MVSHTEQVQEAARRLGERLAEFRRAAGLSQPQLAPLIGYSRSTVASAETGHRPPARDFWRRCDVVLSTGGELTRQHSDLEQLKVHHRQAIHQAAQAQRLARMWESVSPASGLSVEYMAFQQAEALRQELAESVDHVAMSDASLDDWEQTTWQYGLATRHRPAAALLIDLTADFGELRHVLARRRTLLAPSRLTRVTAQMAGLMSLTLIKLDQRSAARNWARLAKLIAADAGDSRLQAWVRAQEAYAYYYSGQLTDAAYAATHAQRIASNAPCAGVALAAALEARAYAGLRRPAETMAALDRAERALAGLGHEERAQSAFGYNEAQFYFHAGNAHTHLGQTAAAYAVHEQALATYPTDDYLDRALVLLDRAECLVRDDEPAAAVDCIARALGGLAADQRDRLIDNRARQVLAQVAAALPAARDLRAAIQETGDSSLVSRDDH